mgnify:CR=1 FL=1
MAFKTDLEKITEITLKDAFFIIIERMDLVNHYYLDPDEKKTYYNRLIIINKDKPKLDEMEKELLNYKKELIELEKAKMKIFKKGVSHGTEKD